MRQAFLHQEALLHQVAAPHQMASMHRAAVHRGITLLEVLISTFIIGMAILGLASLLPVGSYQLGQANQLDRASAVGRAAFRDVVVRDMLNPAGWARYQATSALAASAVDTGSAGPFDDDVLTWDDLGNPDDRIDFQNVDDWAQPFIIDPMLISRAPATIAALASPDLWPGKSFPYDQGYAPLADVPRMPRVTLASTSFDGGSLTPYLGPMKLIEAERIFESHDDLIFEPNADRTVRPRALLRGSLNDPALPSASGDYSWMVMVQRSPAEVAVLQPATASTPPLDILPGNRTNYSISVIVFFKRKFDVEVQPVGSGALADIAGVLPSERVAGIQFKGGGYGGGAVQISAGDEATLSPDLARQYLAARPNQWLMVCGWAPQPTLISNAFGPPYGGQLLNINDDNRTQYRGVYRWYRVVASDSGPRLFDHDGDGGASTPAIWVRDITLVGPDWDESEMAVSGYPGASSGSPNKYCVLVDGVMGVFEKTVRRQN
ncbi:MAG: hypothetical protein K1X74_21335 [Pirellulales bacterium]|nr:hypothetical protein [Pirellulales bacterium]